MTNTGHLPVYLPREDYPGQIGQIGCSCGDRPKKPARSAGTILNPYRAHLRTLGLPSAAHEVTIDAMTDVTYAFGQYAGLTWREMNTARSAS